MKRYINALWICLILVFTGISCSDSENDEPEQVASPKITLDSAKEMTISDKAGQVSIAFTVNKDWTISSSQPWCIPTTQKGGPGKITIPVEVEMNETYDSREATLTIMAGTLKRTVTLIQAQMDAIVLAKNSYEVAGENSKLVFDVQSNVGFNVEKDVEWIKQVTDLSRGLTTYKLKFDIATNLSDTDREGHITITSDDIKQTITVTQKAMQPQRVIITHQKLNFRIPVIEGTIKDAQILWGDNNEETYKTDAQHTYETEDTHVVTIKSKGAESVYMESVDGVIRIDLSQF